jgi:phage FluMu protein Com
MLTTAQDKTLQEYRCPNCQKLLCKGALEGSDSEVEVKCRGCGKICAFHGQDALIASVN